MCIHDYPVRSCVERSGCEESVTDAIPVDLQTTFGRCYCTNTTAATANYEAWPWLMK